MPKTKISEFSSTPANNTDIDSINIAENCPPSGINDAIRELMSQLKDWQSGTSNDPMVIGSSGSLTLNQGTANGVAYLNGSKVVTSGSALTYNGTTLQNSVSGNAATALANVTNSNSGSSSRAVYSFNSDTASGSTGVVSSTWNVDALSTNETYLYGSNGIALYAPSSQVIRFLANGSEGMRLTSTGLGIGTSSPSVKLDVRSGATPTAALLDTTAATAYSGGSFFSGANLIIRSGANATGNGSGIRFASSNNGSLEGMFGWVQNASTYGDFVWQGYNGSYTERMRLDSSGNLGLGVTPSAWRSASKAFQIGSTGALRGETGLTAVISNSYTNTSNQNIYITSDYATSYAQYSGNHVWFNAPSGTAGNALTFTQAMSLTAAGDLLVGQTSLSQTTVGFSATSAGIVSTAMAASTSAANSYHLYSTGAGAYRFYVGLGGTINATNTTITAISDQRLKENIRDLDEGLATVMALKPRKFDWKAGKGQDIKNARGFIAQEFEQVFPDMIEEWLDPAPEGEEPYKAVNANLIPTLVKAIQELKMEFDAYKVAHP